MACSSKSVKVSGTIKHKRDQANKDKRFVLVSEQDIEQIKVNRIQMNLCAHHIQATRAHSGNLSGRKSLTSFDQSLRRRLMTSLHEYAAY